MSDRDFAMAFATLLEAFHVKDATVVRIETYQRGLADVPMPLLNAAVRRAITTRQWFPKVAELRADAEACRLELLRAHPYEGCCECSDSRGFRTVHIEKVAGLTAQVTVEPCPCHRRWQQQMAACGVTSTPLALPEGRRDPVEVD